MSINVFISSTHDNVAKASLSATLGGILAAMGQWMLLIDVGVHLTLCRYCQCVKPGTQDGLACWVMAVSDAPDGRVWRNYWLTRFTQEGVK